MGNHKYGFPVSTVFGIREGGAGTYSPRTLVRSTWGQVDMGKSSPSKGTLCKPVFLALSCSSPFSTPPHPRCLLARQASCPALCSWLVALGGLVFGPGLVTPLGGKNATHPLDVRRHPGEEIEQLVVVNGVGVSKLLGKFIYAWERCEKKRHSKKTGAHAHSAQLRAHFLFRQERGENLYKRKN